MRKYTFGLRDGVHLSFILFLLVMSGLLAGRYYLRGAEDSLAVSPERLGELESEESWYGIYVKNEKIGYSRTSVVTQDSLVISTDRTYMAFQMIGRNQSLNTYSRAVTDQRMQLVSFIFTINGEDTDYGVRGRVDGQWLNLNITVAGETRGERLHIDEPPQLPNTVELLLAGRELKKGLRISTTVFDPGSMANEPLVMEVLGREKITWSAAEKEVWHIREDMGGLRVDSYVDDQGQVLEERSGMGYRMVLEDEQTAREGYWPAKGSDIQRLVAVVPDRPLPAERSLTSLKVEITGVGPDTFGLRGGFQTYENNILEVTSVMPPAERMADSVPAVIRDVNTSPGTFVQSEHPRLLALAAQIIKIGDSPAEKIRSIMRWMNSNIEKKPTFSIPNTLEVLERKSGDCNEFAVLFCSFARAAGIPTRIAMGLVYVEDAFYYHAWCECYLGGWVSVDPIFGQFPADATHLRFMAGDMDRQVEILPLVGQVGIKVLDFSTGQGAAK